MCWGLISFSRFTAHHEWMQAHGDLLQIKAFLHSIAGQPDIAPEARALVVAHMPAVLELAVATGCPAVAAECIEVSKATLSLLSSGAHNSSTDVASFATAVKAACRTVLEQESTAEHAAGHAEQPGAGKGLRRLAMRPVLVESAVTGFFDASAAIQASMVEPREGWLVQEDVLLLIRSGAREVRRTGLQSLLTLSTQGKPTSAPARHRGLPVLPAGAEPGIWRLAGSRRPPAWLGPMLAEYSLTEADRSASHLAHCLRALLPASSAPDGQPPELDSVGQASIRQRIGSLQLGLPAPCGPPSAQPACGGQAALDGSHGSGDAAQHLANGSTPTGREEWERLQRLLQDARSPDAKEGLLQSMGALAAQALHNPSRQHSGSCGSIVVGFLQAVREASDAAAIPSSRLAAQEALKESGTAAIRITCLWTPRPLQCKTCFYEFSLACFALTEAQRAACDTIPSIGSVIDSH